MHGMRAGVGGFIRGGSNALLSRSIPHILVPVRNLVRIRMQRRGRKNLPYYRIVVAHSKSPRDGRFIERVSSSHKCTSFSLTFSFLSGLLFTYMRHKYEYTHRIVLIILF